FHLGLHKMSVMFAEMFFADRFGDPGAEQSLASCIYEHLQAFADACYNWGPNVDRNALYMLIGALIVVVAGFSYYAYQQEKQPDGVEIKLNEQGLSIEGN
ncbi:MAG: hypothetical protein ACT6WE_27380, partial [Shinella sp.]|uniref:hypothetical protein n=1 Tax=Shinella sp. TaxID=1870904 RepID=UPI00403549EC